MGETGKTRVEDVVQGTHVRQGVKSRKKGREKVVIFVLRSEPWAFSTVRSSMRACRHVYRNQRRGRKKKRRGNENNERGISIL